LIDLAGSERYSLTNTSKVQKEGVNINLSLSTLNRCLMNLSQNESNKAGI